MDYTILFAIGIVVVLIGLAFLAKTLRKKNIVTSDDLMFATNLLGLSVAIIDELNLREEDRIKDISKIVIDAVQYVVANMGENINRKEIAYAYALALCIDMNIFLSEERKLIVKQLVELSFNKITIK